MHHSIKIGEDGIAYAKIIGSGGTKIAEKFVQDSNEIFDANPGKKFDAVVDMLETGISNYGGIKIYKEFVRDERLGKIAFAITHEVAKALVKIVTKAKGDDVAFFDSLDEAKKWIKTS